MDVILQRGRRGRFLLLFLLLGVVAVGCGGSRDDRDEIRSKFGEPDDIEYTEGPFSDIEIWSYYDFNQSGKTRFYRFEKSRNSCGGDQWSLVLSGDIEPVAGAPEDVAAAPPVADPPRSVP